MQIQELWKVWIFRNILKLKFRKRIDDFYNLGSQKNFLSFSVKLHGNSLQNLSKVSFAGTQNQKWIKNPSHASNEWRKIAFIFLNLWHCTLRQKTCLCWSFSYLYMHAYLKITTLILKFSFVLLFHSVISQGENVLEWDIS